MTICNQCHTRDIETEGGFICNECLSIESVRRRAPFQDAVLAELQAIRQELAAPREIARDAARYRLLRGSFMQAGEYSVVRTQDILPGRKRYLDLALDDLLDAATEQEEK